MFTTKVIVLNTKELNNMLLKALIITIVTTTLGSGDTSMADTNLQIVTQG